jgi:hypothetical protein
MPKLRPLPERAPISSPAVTEVVPQQRPPHGFQKGHKRFGGRGRNQQNVVSRDVRSAIVAGLNAAGGGNMADYVTRVALADHRVGVAMMSLVCPKAIDATVHHEQVLLTVEDLDASLLKAGLPRSSEIFKIDYKNTVIDDEVEEEEIFPKK